MIAAVGVVTLSVPQGVAYAMIAGLPPAMGLYATCIPAIVGSLLRSSKHVVAGPTNALSLLVGGALVGQSADPMSAAITLALLVGLMQVGAGLLRLGSVVDYISSPVVLGYISGAGVLIGVGQLHNITGTSGPKGGLLETLEGWIAVGPAGADPLTVGFAVATVVLLVAMHKLIPKIPGAVIAMVLAIGVNMALSLELVGLRVIADIAPIPVGLPPLTIPDPSLIVGLIPAAVACTVLSLVESSAIARSIASETGQRLSASREFFGQGMANIAAAFFGGYPISGSLSRSALNAQLGAKTRWAGVLSGVLMLVVMLVLGPIVDHTPIAALAGLLLVVAAQLIDVSKIRRTIQTRPADGIAFGVTFIAALLIPLNQAIYLGVGISVVLFLQRARMISVLEMVIGPNGRLRAISDPLPDETLPEDFSRCGRIKILHVEGVLFFGAAGELQAALDEAAEGVDVLVVRIKRTQGIDVTIIDVLESVAVAMERRGQHLLLVGMKPRVMAALRRAGAVEVLGKDALFPSRKRWFAAMNEAIESAIELSQPSCERCAETGCVAAAYIEAQCARREREKARAKARSEEAMDLELSPEGRPVDAQ
ncbi:MAG: SulP family sulfate permease [Myxococcota bacterium]|jgi:SulP family sulfate permease